ncbi:4-hydroxy-3-methylbut-2-en-1-yl diphosphate reductase [Bathymodiolus platifrons methanotrophic gill symbiont]|uniref:4-hydroxy-3-methylbut-2-enyl diphosphate reductase n=1 Tax=Bathymodiolus platifrons methanotrophic gill symbiont TaxID=113268 RepID=UPI000B41157A|nr:4-hydroxy-3-methylbut-2-enyl diphosphate reductase [Bathymodiolus platifrons methanotrophic gill symbiont]TXL14422.1 4-hydroxy-3-methylbut-2-enyl diphosphate reductase [Methylococcaceae bacterium HT4]TXL20411.1 4-hydroxy-3-methylbut-2-enyl diphosphate reductase [Methylococcaceae bacterium HT5]GAW85980.1 4-hydroxy-3-methylbut-2-en-1-yl diphosphate reductase [Bathymodiolus platifrons methanotrophic gill symbiont]GFO75383.1 4-hydroxy-3-methylbut-2-en-1-yl diphosphate reductase [Bathymodiolus pl
MKIELANPRGFCAGVDRAIEIVDRAIEAFGAPIYVRHEVVHNRTVVDGLREKGAIFIEELSDVPEGSYLIFSAHGVSKKVQKEAVERNLTVFDATCPLVTKVHIQVAKHAKADREVFLIGHEGHPEVEGTMGQYEKCTENGAIYLVETPEDVRTVKVNNPENLAYVTQTTLSMTDTSVMVDALHEHFPHILEQKKDDICYATQNRQDAVHDLAENADIILVVGSTNSSNSNRLREIAEQLGKPAHLIDTAADMHQDWFTNVDVVGVTAGASAPEVLVQEVIKQLQDWGGETATEIKGIEEKVVFTLPKELKLHMEKR